MLLNKGRKRRRLEKPKQKASYRFVRPQQKEGVSRAKYQLLRQKAKMMQKTSRLEVAIYFVLQNEKGAQTKKKEARQIKVNKVLAAGY